MATPPAAPCLASSREVGLLHRCQAVGTGSPTGPPSLALRTPGQASGTSHTARALVQGTLLHLRLPGFSSRPALRFHPEPGAGPAPRGRRSGVQGPRGAQGSVNVSCALKMQPVTPSSSKSQRGHGSLNVQLSISLSYLLSQDWSPHMVTGENNLTDGWTRALPTQLGSQGSGFPASRTRATHHPGKEKGARVSPPTRQQPVTDDKSKDKIQRNTAVPGDWGRDGSREQGAPSP